jgi:integrase
VRASTLVSYQGHVERHISPLLGGIVVARLQPSDVRRLIADRLAAGLSPASVGRIVTTLRIALNQAVRDRSIPDNPAAAVRLPRVQREPIRAATADDFSRIREAVRGDQLEALYVLLMGTGMRCGEACDLDWRDVDLDGGTVFIRRGKTSRSVRTINLSASVVLALRAHRAKAPRVGPNEPVFLGPRAGERLRTWTVSHAFPRLLERHGLPRMRVHDLRHGFATRAISRGASLRTVADILGHARPSQTTDTYAHVVPEDQRQAVDFVGAELA